MDWRAGKAVPLHPGPLSGGFAVLYSFLVTGNTLPLLCGMWYVACGSIVATQVQSSTRSPSTPPLLGLVATRLQGLPFLASCCSGCVCYQAMVCERLLSTRQPARALLPAAVGMHCTPNALHVCLHIKAVPCLPASAVSDVVVVAPQSKRRPPPLHALSGGRACWWRRTPQASCRLVWLQAARHGMLVCTQAPCATQQPKACGHAPLCVSMLQPARRWRRSLSVAPVATNSHCSCL